MSLALLVFALLAIALVIAGLNWLIRYSLRAPRILEQGSPAQRGLAYQTVSIPGARNKQLFGWYIPAPDNARAPAVAGVAWMGRQCRDDAAGGGATESGGICRAVIRCALSWTQR